LRPRQRKPLRIEQHHPFVHNVGEQILPRPHLLIEVLDVVHQERHWTAPADAPRLARHLRPQRIVLRQRRVLHDHHQIEVTEIPLSQVLHPIPARVTPNSNTISTGALACTNAAIAVI
jgi:hypothetical protein